MQGLTARLRTSIGAGQLETTWSPRQVAAAVRLLVLALVFALALIGTHRTAALEWLPLLAVLALVASFRDWSTIAARFIRVAEAIGCVIAVLESGDATSPLFPYLLAPGFAGGLSLGYTGAAIPTGIAALGLVVGGLVTARESAYSAASAEWVVLALAVGLVAAWTRSLLLPRARPEQQDTSYAAAYRLLAQLRPVARQLSVGLDPVTIAEGLLQSLRDHYDYERGSVFVRTEGSRLVPLAHWGAERAAWEVDVTDEGPFAEAWLSQRQQRLTRQLSGAPGSGLVIPLVIGLRSFGLIGLESRSRSFGSLDAASVARIVDEAALRLETALLFDEVRGVATAEERRRLAREIHDGIAQELSYLGYVVDSLTGEAKEQAPELAGSLRDLRAEITRIVSELRMSIFDLRSEVDAHGGLGAALSEYVRMVGRQSGLTVHLSLAEGANRLPAQSEAELLRIAQEAVTNARKHAEAENLWVTLEVEPPLAVLRVEDDGRGLGTPREDSYGLQIMRERAGRLRTGVTVTAREPQGTTVEVRLGGAEATTLSGQDSAPAATAPSDDLEELPRR